MWMDDLKLDFSGFRPSLSLSNHIRDIAADILADAPSDSFTRASVRRLVDGTGEVFEGILRVSSSVGTFLVQERDTDVIRLMGRLQERITSQLDLWKRHRFAEEGHG
ncbi:MAG: hypothetical protein NDI61_10370 [Bdellovibrionaceae bacterium]|nr:hypothetical protein [Pseudobdellovibrionaceae bacterium]